MTRIMTVSRDGRWARLALAAAAAVLWMATQAALPASAAPGQGFESDSSATASDSSRGKAPSTHPGKGPLPGSVRWR